MKQTKTNIIKSLAINEKDVGSAEVQIGLLSKKIEKLSEHFKNIPDIHFINGIRENGIKYLKAMKPFDVGIKDNNVSCFNSNKEDIEKKNAFN